MDRVGVPAERETLPYGEAVRVEAENDEDQQRGMEKCQREGGVNAERADFHVSSRAIRLGIRNARRSALASINTSEAAEPNGQSRAVVNWFCTRLPSITVFPPPRRSGVR